MTPGDTRASYTKLIAEVLLERPDLVDQVVDHDLAPGLDRDLIRVIRERYTIGRPADLAGLMASADDPDIAKCGGRDRLLDLRVESLALVEGLPGYLVELRRLAAEDELRREVERGEGPDAGRVRALADRLEPVVQDADPPAFLDWSTFWAMDHKESDWAFEPILARGRGHSIYAKHKVGKSLLLLYLAVEMVKAGHVVLYLDYEMSEADIHERLSDMGHGEGSDLARLRYALLPSLSPLNSPAGGSQLLALVDDAQATWPERHVVVCIDTISRAVAGEENSNDPIQDFYRFVGLGLKQRGVTCVRLDHEGHEPGHPRGASAKGDDVDVIWRLAATDDGLELRRSASRMGWVPEKVTFRMFTAPVLRFEQERDSWVAGTHEVARLLDDLCVPIEVGTRTAMKALKDAGSGRRREVVVAAQRWRRMVAEQRDGGAGTTPEPPPEQASGTTSGTATQEPPENGAEPPPEPPGTTLAGRTGTTGGVYVVPPQGTSLPLPQLPHGEQDGASSPSRVPSPSALALDAQRLDTQQAGDGAEVSS